MDRNTFLGRVEREHDIIDNSNMDELGKHEAHIELEREAREEYQQNYTDDYDY